MQLRYSVYHSLHEKSDTVREYMFWRTTVNSDWRLCFFMLSLLPLLYCPVLLPVWCVTAKPCVHNARVWLQATGVNYDCNICFRRDATGVNSSLGRTGSRWRAEVILFGMGSLWAVSPGLFCMDQICPAAVFHTAAGQMLFCIHVVLYEPFTRPYIILSLT